MMYKNRQWADSPRTLQWVPKEQKTNNLIESTGVVSAKDSPKIKLVIEKSLKAFVVRELGNFCVPRRGENPMLI